MNRVVSRLFIAAAMIASSTSLAQARELTISNQYHPYPGCKTQYTEYLRIYGPAQSAIRTVFDPYGGRYVSGTAMPTVNARCRFTPHSAVRHLTEVDAPVQGRDTQSLIRYLRNRNHPQNGDVTVWYKTNFRL